MAKIYPTAYVRNAFVPLEDANLSIASSPVLYGLSTYSVFQVSWEAASAEAKIFRLKDHYVRLCRSCKILAFDDFVRKWDFERFEKIMKRLIERNNPHEDVLVRVSVFVDGIVSGTRMAGLPHEMSIFMYSASPLLPASGARLGVSSWRRTPDNAIPARAKVNGNYVNSALMKHEAETCGYDDAIALDEQGHVTESSVANIFLVREGVVVTPNGSADLLEGITRDSVVKFCQQTGLATETRTVDRTELYTADEIFLSGSSMRIAPVIAVDGRKIGNGHPGAITHKIATLYDQATAGRLAGFEDWITTVSLKPLNVASL